MSFPQFLIDMGSKPSPKHTLDRLDNDGPYTPHNCRWATAQEQIVNRQCTTKVRYYGEVKTLAELSKAYGIAFNVLWDRIMRYGWDVPVALSTPVGGRNASS